MVRRVIRSIDLGELEGFSTIFREIKNSDDETLGGKKRTITGGKKKKKKTLPAQHSGLSVVGDVDTHEVVEFDENTVREGTQC